MGLREALISGGNDVIIAEFDFGILISRIPRLLVDARLQYLDFR